MEPHERPRDFHPQDWIIIVEVLTQWAGPPEEAEGRRDRAYELIEAIGVQERLSAEELVRQV